MRTTLGINLVLAFVILWADVASAQNPIVTDQFTADPTARVFENRVYVYPSHDVNCGTNWFCMKDYHVFSSENLVDWTDHGMIVSQEEVPWVNSTTNSMWAPDAYFANGKYYFYFPAIGDSAKGVRGMAIGVATSDSPDGPFVPEPAPIKGVSGIDPNVFIDRDGQAYLYWAGRGQLLGARLDDSMLTLATEPQVIESLPGGFKEGPYLFERDGVYYFTFPRVIEKTEALVYATGKNPLGPFEYQGIIMDEHPSGCWTNHHSIVEYQGQWYLFYHHNDLSPNFDKNRSIRADSLFFNADGTIRKVTPTLRGVGVVQATADVQVDRYSARSADRASIAFLDSSNTFAGWKATLAAEGAWLTFNRVDFGAGLSNAVVVRAFAENGGRVEIEAGTPDAPYTVQVDVPASETWQTVRTELPDVAAGVRDLRLTHRDGGPVEIDWIRFE